MNKVNIQRLFDALWRAAEHNLFVSSSNFQSRVVTDTPPTILTSKDLKKLSLGEIVTTEQELIDKGYKVNFLGFVAICKEFQEDGGSNNSSLAKIDPDELVGFLYRKSFGFPVFNGEVGHLALAKWLDISSLEALSIVNCPGFGPISRPMSDLDFDRYAELVTKIDIHDYINTIGALRFK